MSSVLQSGMQVRKTRTFKSERKVSVIESEGWNGTSARPSFSSLNDGSAGGHDDDDGARPPVSDDDDDGARPPVSDDDDARPPRDEEDEWKPPMAEDSDTEMEKGDEDSEKARFSSYCFTDFVNDWKFYDRLFQKNNIKYIIVGEEIAPSTGRKHLQGYLYMKSKTTWSSMRKKLAPRWFAICKGNPKQNIEYCSKDKKFKIWGEEPPMQGRRTDLEAARKLLKSGMKPIALAELDFGMWTRNYRAFDLYSQYHAPKRTWKTQVHCIWGESGAGKSYPINHHLLPVLQKYEDMTEDRIEEWLAHCNASQDKHNPFIAGYKGQEVVLFDDFNPQQMSREYMLKLTDQYPMEVNIKNGSMRWAPRIIFFTANNDPRDWYSTRDPEDYDGPRIRDKAWNRRITSCTLIAENAFMAEGEGIHD